MRICLAQEVDFFLREVQRGLHQHAQVDEGITQAMDLGRKSPGQRAAGAAGSRLGAGVDQVGNRLGLGQVDLVVQEGSFGELARQGDAQAAQIGLAGSRVGGGTRLQAACQQQLQHHRAAVGLQLQHVFAGVAVRAGKVQRQPLVDGLALRIAKGQVGGLAGLEGAPANRLHQRIQPAP